jgi:hypothetical protein
LAPRVQAPLFAQGNDPIGPAPKLFGFGFRGPNLFLAQ